MFHEVHVRQHGTGRNAPSVRLALLMTFSLGLLSACGAQPTGGATSAPPGLSDVLEGAYAAQADVTAPSAPSNLTWNAVGMTVTLSWGASTDDVGVAAYQLFFGNFFLGEFTDTSLALIGFKAATPYVFSVKARDAAGNVSVASNQTTVLISGDDTTPPSAPSNLTATNVGSTTVSLRWTASTDNVGVVIYQLYAGTTLAGTIPAATSGTVSSLKPSTTYTFTAKAVDSAGNVSAASNSVTVTTTGSGDTTPPSVPTGLTLAARTSSTATLIWTASTDDVAVVGYDLSYTMGASTVVITATADSTGYTFTGLSTDAYLNVYVSARDAAGNKSATTGALFVPPYGVTDTVPPSVPTGLAASSVTSNAAVLSWNASTDNFAVVAYDVYNGSTLAGSSATTSFSVTGLSPATTYSFTVKARDNARNVSAASSATAVTTLSSGGGGGGASYELNPPEPCDSQFWVQGCESGTCGGVCQVANNCSPPEDPSKSSKTMTYACPRDMLYSSEFLQAQQDDAKTYGWDPSDPPFNYAVVGHDFDQGGIDSGGSGWSTCCNCYQLVFEMPEPGSPQPPTLPIPKPLVVQSFNTAAGGGKNFDVFMGAGGFGAFDGCVAGTYSGSTTTAFGHFPYSSFPGQFNGNGGIKFYNVDACKVNGVVSMANLSSSACQSAIGAYCDTATSANSVVTAETRYSCKQTNLPTSLYHQNWTVRAKRVECPAALTRVTGCRLASQGLPSPDPTAQTVSTADSTFKSGYTTTTMQDCCKPTCAWQDNVKAAGLVPSGNWNAFYSCDQNGVPITTASP